MTAPIIMLTVLALPYAITRVLNAFTDRRRSLDDAAVGGLALLFMLTATGHFTDTDSMAQMLPAWVPNRAALVYLSGLFELALAAAFLVRRTRLAAGWGAAVLLVLLFPVNVYAAIHHAPQGGHAWGPAYLLIRGPLQAIIWFWNYWFVLRRRKEFARGRPNRVPNSGEANR